MITILHGENIVRSRQELVDLLETAKNKQIKISRLEASKLTVPNLESQLTKTDLFGNQRLVVIEGLHSLRRSKKKTQLIELVAGSDTDVCLWEERELTKTMLKKFKQAKIKQFKLSNSLFAWLDTVSTGAKSKQIKLLKKAIIDNDEYMCLAMLARQIRLLITAKDGGKIKGPGFVQRKIKQQARKFKLNQLLKIHRQLYHLDSGIKTSTNPQPVAASLEWLTVQI